MGPATTKALIAAVLASLSVARVARAEPGCTGTTDGGGRFATCFDPGNRLSITAGSDGFGGDVELRHVIHFEDDPDLAWKLEHTLLDATYAGFENRFSGALYHGRFVRHTRDGHIVLPFGAPRTLHLPFDIGGEAEVGRVSWRPGDPIARLEIVKTAALIDLARSHDFARYFAIGPVGHWDVALEREAIAVAEHVVVPFSAAQLSAHAESANGITVFDLAVEAGSAWHSTTGWRREAAATASVERIVLAVNDRPIALVLGVGYSSATGEAIARIGARIVLIHHRDARVRLDSLASASAQ